MSDILFYHLQRQPLERVLPQLLEKTLERSWKAVIRCGSAERLQALDDLLWTWRDSSFLPHGTHIEEAGESQPIYLTLGDERPNAAEVLFLVDGAILEAEILDAASISQDSDIQSEADYSRKVLIFDGNDNQQLTRARQSWKDIASRGLTGQYWQQDDKDHWVRKA